MRKRSKRGQPINKFLRPITFEHFEHSRNISFAGAGVCLAITLTLVQIQLKTTAANVALISSCSALPMWLAGGVINSLFIHLGENYFLLAERIEKIMFWLLLLAGPLVILSLGACIFITYPPAAIAFVIVSLAAYVTTGVATRILAIHHRNITEKAD